MSKRIGEDSSLVLSVLGYDEPSDTTTAEEKLTPKRKPAKKKPPKEKKDVHINLALTASLVQALKDEAWEQRRSLNSLAEEILSAYISKKRK